ncbi:hypothetical protein Tco_1280646, partial [Tanacetum coccineum]
NLLQEIDDPDITIKEYIQLEDEKARRRGQEFNWETATYGKVSYFEDIDYFKDFENEFQAIVYKDALASEPKDIDYFKDYVKKISVANYRRRSMRSPTDVTAKIERRYSDWLPTDFRRI